MRQSLPALARDVQRRTRYRRRLESEYEVDIYTIIFLALAVFIFLRLRNVLGQRTGSERPPYDRAARNVIQGAPDKKVVPMPGTVIDQAPLAPTADVVPPSDRWKGLPNPERRWPRGSTASSPRIPHSIRGISSAAHAAPMR